MSAKTARAATAEANVVCPSHLKGSTLPRDWEWVSLGNICRTTSGGTPSRKNKEYFEGDIPWVKSGELPDGPVSEIEEYITGDAVKNSSAKQFPKGTLLIALYGATVGKLGVLTQEAATNQAVCAIFPPDDLETKYLFWYLRFVRSDLIAQAIGGAQPNISQGILRNLLIPIAPPNEQKSIVAEIEKQFSRLDEAVANLKRVKANLKRYKAAVLKAAVEGRLTEDWRKQHPNVEPASKLLERILAERRAKWKGNGTYKEPDSLDTSNLPELPDSWCWANLEQIKLFSLYGPRFSSEDYATNGPLVLRTSDISESGKVRQDTAPRLSLTADEVSKYRLERGDLLITRTGSLGTLAVFNDAVEAIPGAYLIQYRMGAPFETVQYIFHFFKSPVGQKQLIGGGAGVGRPNLNAPTIEAISIPLPSLAEQMRIVAEVERRLSIIEELEAAVESNLTRADRLRQSILSQAFSGRLNS